MELKIYGTGCANCKRLHQVSEKAAQALGLDYEVEKVDNIELILSAGVMRTPALGVDGKLVLSGRVPSLDEVKALLAEHAAVASAG